MTLERAPSQNTIPDVDENDEYDEYNVSIDIDLLPYVTEFPGSQDSPRDVMFELQDPTSPRSTYSDRFSDYGFPELTAEELAAFDAAILAAETVEEEEKTAWTAISENPLVGNSSSGPAVEIEIECNADDIAGRQTPPNGDAVPQAGPSNDGVPSSINEPSRFKATNFYKRFRSWRGTLSVTDLVDPSWCVPFMRPWSSNLGTAQVRDQV